MYCVSQYLTYCVSQYLMYCVSHITVSDVLCITVSDVLCITAIWCIVYHSIWRIVYHSIWCIVYHSYLMYCVSQYLMYCVSQYLMYCVSQYLTYCVSHITVVHSGMHTHVVTSSYRRQLLYAHDRLTRNLRQTLVPEHSGTVVSRASDNLSLYWNKRTHRKKQKENNSSINTKRNTMENKQFSKIYYLNL